MSRISVWQVFPPLFSVLKSLEPRLIKEKLNSHCSPGSWSSNSIEFLSPPLFHQTQKKGGKERESPGRWLALSDSLTMWAAGGEANIGATSLNFTEKAVHGDNKFGCGWLKAFSHWTGNHTVIWGAKTSWQVVLPFSPSPLFTLGSLPWQIFLHITNTFLHFRLQFQSPSS